ncbi:hypothetical protein D3C73_534300 [compost metagenome]
MKEIKKHHNMRTLAIALFSVVFIFSCISCTSISPKYLAQNAAAHSVSKVELKETYIVDIDPKEIILAELVSVIQLFLKDIFGLSLFSIL